MAWAALSPILSGLFGGVIAAWLLTKLARWVPETCEHRPIGEILRENRWRVRGANIVGLLGLVGGVALYKLGVFASNDWRGMGLGFGIACVAPAVVLVVVSSPGGRRGIREALVAYAVGQATPPILLYSIMAVGAVVLFFTLGSLRGA